LAPVHVYRQPDDGQKIYDKALIAGTLAILDRENGRSLDESAIGGWLDEIYSGEVARRWQEEYTVTADDFEAICVRTLRPFAADEGLEEQFYRAFDGLQVLPKSLYDEYEKLKEEEPIRANELLVSISWGRYHALANEGRVLPRERREPYVVKAAYSSEIGLTFDELPDEEDDDWI
jgi:CRISPR-associated endonuclease/helicase Cas3